MQFAGLSLWCAGLILSPASAALETSAPFITTAPPDRRVASDKRGRDNSDAAFIAYNAADGNWFTVMCAAGEEYTTRSGLGNCCERGGTACNFKTGCGAGGTVLYDSPGGNNCRGEDVCVTVTIMSSRDELEGSHSLVRCFYNEFVDVATRTWYKETYALSTETRMDVTGTEPAGNVGNDAHEDGDESGAGGKHRVPRALFAVNLGAILTTLYILHIM